MPGLKLMAEIGMDGSGFERGIRGLMGGPLGGLKSMIAGAFTVGALTAFTRSTIQLASHLSDISDALSVNVEWFQRRANAAKLAGGTEDDLFRTLDTINRMRAEAVNKPGGEQAAAFGRLGFSGGDVAGLSPQAFFDRIVKAFASGANQQTDADVEKIGGRSARNLLAAFKTGFDSDLPVMSESLVFALDEIDDSFVALKSTFTVSLAPAIKWVADQVSSLVNNLRQVGTLFGGFWGNLVGNIRDQTSNDQTPGDNVKGIWRGVVKSWNDAAREVVSEEAEQQNDADIRARARESARLARKRRAEAAPGFLPPEEKEKAGRPRSIATDALVGIGNFLGRNTSLVNNVADQQLQIARLQLTAQNGTNTRIDRLITLNSSSSGGTLGIPST